MPLINNVANYPRHPQYGRAAECNSAIQQSATCSVEKIRMDAFRVTVALVCFFHHSPLAGANDEKSTISLIVYPGWRLLRSLTPGYHLSPFQGFRMAVDIFYKAITNLGYRQMIARTSQYPFRLSHAHSKNMPKNL
jgi:hypothetical protein